MKSTTHPPSSIHPSIHCIYIQFRFMFSFRCRAIVAICGEGEAVEKQTHTHRKLAWNFNLYATNKWLSFSGGGGLKRESHGNICWLCYFNLLPICLPTAWLIFSQCERTCIFPLISFCQMMKMVIFLLLLLCFLLFSGILLFVKVSSCWRKKTSTTASYAYSIGIYLHDFWFSNEPGGDDDDDYGDDDNFLADSNW